MSFMDDVGKLAGGLLGGASPEEASSAASDHVQSMDAGQLGDHLTQSLGNMDQASVAGLGQQLLQSFTSHASYAGDANSAAQEAGVSQDAVGAGDPGAVGMLINLAKNNPGVLQGAASSFLGNNPGAISSLAPGLLQGILGRLGR